MKTLQKLMLVALLLAVLAVPGFAQTTTTSTTLTAAVTASADTILVTSATTFAAGNYVWIDGELMRIKSSYVSGLSIPVLRGQVGTLAMAHANASTLYVGTNDNFPQTDKAGSCTSANETYLPWPATTGYVWDCINSQWTPIRYLSWILAGETGTATASAGAATLNKQSGTITSESLTTAAAADYVLTLTNSRVNANSIVMASPDQGTNTTEGLAINRVTPAAGSVVIRVRNTHASSAYNGTIKINFVIVKN